MYKLGVMSTRAQVTLLLIGVAAIFVGAVGAIEEASKYFWGQRYAEHVTHAGSALWFGGAVLLVMVGAALVTGSIVGVARKPARRRKTAS